ncbi:U6 snRNA phosphodiesterase-like [Amphibalanus amphitrite]|uniref:U6 snRNA phosphodiesterase-like n=1 Tax=Amphibalanus amphitrite TaxID=1232801 RepID=UPI001C927440|nr:U6 snRNA phosphodiesterase-like [Amphibalanus amphitrite]XP_043231897.1 U6 snRNA phosphodiesterase-like [Amphibalanus amphitrite]XP_043231898.1 U6 snRNA phosphodiesterase-like [Amphibalanus amphitrite]XP_043231899.1 U6 snRNA phosphodiesterase-like [Amphibalanus amphitrite]XP_043231901.1 U6 snRNA phosphodiesterase-like [Amphibalanus amphitrite]XP_043231902.1 U6 snRNA phosphodiesterase-like [Amphibalanus amphitrite]
MSRCQSRVVTSPQDRKPAALSALQQYGGSESDSDSDMEVDVERLAEKRRNSDRAAPESKRPREALPLPSAVQEMFSDQSEQHQDKPDEHEGRVRGFAHVRGNWASYVFIPFEATPLFDSLVQTCLVICERLVKMTAQEEFHISLTRTVVLKHHWIQEFVQSIRQAMESFQRFQLSVGPARVYVNDEGTRTFLGLTVTTGLEAVTKTSQRLDRCLDEYGLPPFYEEGSFHLSVAWAVGDRSAALQRLLPELDTAVATYASQSPLVCDVTRLECRCGNRRFDVPLGGAER